MDIQIPSFIRSALQGSRPMKMSLNDIVDTNILASSSFMYDAISSPLKSTQQINVDWSQLQNHTFFNSAFAKTNSAFEHIINAFPFDGTQSELEDFFEKLPGYDRWVFDSFPKNTGELQFDSSYVVINDVAGGLFPNISKVKSGATILNPKPTDSLTIEFHLCLPAAANALEVVCQKMSSPTMGYAVYLLPSLSTSTCDVQFTIVSGSTYLQTSAAVNKGTFNHIAAMLSRDVSNGSDTSSLVINQAVTATSRGSKHIGTLDINAAAFTIASGTKITTDTTYLPTQILSGTMDELRMWFAPRTADQLKAYATKTVYASDDLKLYLKFNEPSGSLSTTTNDPTEAILLDSSGNSLHSLVTNFNASQRTNTLNDTLSLMINEKQVLSPVLFPGYNSVQSLNEALLTSASLYDEKNPNLITKLVPQHYLLDERAFNGTPDDPTTNVTLTGNSPKTGETGDTYLMLSFLYIFASFFDDIKLYIDAFANLKSVDYNINETVPDNFLLNFMDSLGFKLPPFFNDASLEQYVNGNDITSAYSSETNALKFVQSQLLRRILVNIPDIIKSKGTLHSIKSFFRAVGIDPDTTMRIKEYGGPTTRSIKSSREVRTESAAVLMFSGSAYAVTPYLSSSRLEVGFPAPAGTMTNKTLFPPHGISSSPSDGLLTSGSWTIEFDAKYTPREQKKTGFMTTQSLCRMYTTGSAATYPNLIANIAAISPSEDGSTHLQLHLRSGLTTGAPVLLLDWTLPSNVLFDGERWNISFGCVRGDAIGLNTTSSYFMRAAYQEEGKIAIQYSTSSYFDEGSSNVLRTVSSTYNSSGSFITLGNGYTTSNGTVFLNASTGVSPVAKSTALNASIGNFRFWSKALTQPEWEEHVRNYASVGVEDPTVNYNFTHTPSGSFERLRLQTFEKQDVVSTDVNGDIELIDFSYNNRHVAGYGFMPNTRVLVGDTYMRSFLSTTFDEAITSDKVRVRGYSDPALIQQHDWATTGPVYMVEPSETPTDDMRFAIDFSLIDALNRDIATLFSSYDVVSNALGAPEMMFSPDYPKLENMRDIYFNKVSSKLNFKTFFDFFRWFDISLGGFIEQLIPRRTNFKGLNFVVESHMLERHKVQYKSEEMYLTEINRKRIKDVLLLQQVVGNLRKW